MRESSSCGDTAFRGLDEGVENGARESFPDLVAGRYFGEN
jgi:hypothetical protein